MLLLKTSVLTEEMKCCGYMLCICIFRTCMGHAAGVCQLKMYSQVGVSPSNVGLCCKQKKLMSTKGFKFIYQVQSLLSVLYGVLDDLKI